MPKVDRGENINKFTQYFDKDWKTCRSSLKYMHSDDKSYDPSVSWDGRSDNPKAFARLQAKEMPYQPGYPITMSGKAVIPLEAHDGLPIFGAYGSETKSSIPLTTEQRDLGMQGSLRSEIPLAEQARAGGQVVCIDETPSFRNNEMRPPQFRSVEMPGFIKEVGPQADKKLMTPAQRRELLDFEIRTRAAGEYMRKAASDRAKTRKQIGGIQFHRGVLMYDSTNNIDSEAYGDKAKALAGTMGKLDSFHSERQEHIARTQGKTMQTVLNTGANQGSEAISADRNFFQSKGRQNTFDNSFSSTYNTLFGRVDTTIRPERTQYLRDQDLSGKQYDLVCHTRVEHCPPSNGFTRQENRILSHPSQACLEGQRNLQGTLLPGGGRAKY